LLIIILETVKIDTSKWISKQDAPGHQAILYI